MITRFMWKYCIDDKDETTFDIFEGITRRITTKDIAFQILICIICTPITIIIDILLLPIEILYVLIEFFVEKHYKNEEIKQIRKVFGKDNESN